MILDEPANGLDPGGIRWLRNFLKDYAAEGNAVLVSSHLLSEMSLLTDQIVVIGRGKLIAKSPEELTASGSRAGVFVRSKQTAKLEAALKGKNTTTRSKADAQEYRAHEAEGEAR